MTSEFDDQFGSRPHSKGKLLGDASVRTSKGADFSKKTSALDRDMP